MPVLDPPNILPELGFVAFRVLARHQDPMSWSDLRSQIVPESRRDSQADGSNRRLESSEVDPTKANDANDPLNQTLRALAELGVFELGGGTIRLVSQPNDLGDRHFDRREYTRLLSDCAMANAMVHIGTWDTAPGASDLARSLAFTMVLDPHRPAFFPAPTGKLHDEIRTTGVDVETLRITHIGGGGDNGQVIHNVERWRPFQRWSIALGFAAPIPPLSAASGSQQTLLAIDPTAAIHVQLPLIAPGSYVADDFLKLVSDRLPVLPPHGALFQSLMTHWLGEAPTSGSDVPPTVSHALLRLHESGAISLESGADARKATRLVVEYGNDERNESARQVSRVKVP